MRETAGMRRLTVRMGIDSKTNRRLATDASASGSPTAGTEEAA